MKKIISIILAVIVLIMVLSFSGCSKTADSSGKSLYDHGLELVTMVEEITK